MPKRKRGKRGGRRTRSGKRRKLLKRTAVNRPGNLNLGTGSILPQALRAKHKFTQEFELNDTLTGAGHTFRLNSMFDPDLTGVGTQPRLFDQMATLYERYLVLGCKIRVRYHVVRAGTANSDDQGFVTFHWYPEGGAITVGSSPIKEFGEQDGTSYRPLSGALNNGEMSNGKFKRYVSMNKLFHKNVFNEEDYGAGYGSNPAIGAFFSCAVYKDTNAVRLQVRFYVDMTYYAIWRRPRDVPDS